MRAPVQAMEMPPPDPAFPVEGMPPPSSVGAGVTRAMAIVLVVCVAVRGLLRIIYQPAVAPDTHGYVRLAHLLQRCDLSTHDGRRTPGYPLLLLLTGLDYDRVWLVQSLLGTAVALMLVALVYRSTGSRGWGLIAGLVYALSLNQLFFEAGIVTETLSTFLVTLSLVLFAFRPAGNRGRNLANVLLGSVVALAGLTRPMLFCLAPVYLAFLLARPDPRRESARGWSATVYLAPIVAVFLGWGLVNYRIVGYFGPTTLTGFNLTNHSGGFIEYAPDRYGPVRDIYLRFRAQHVAETGSHTMTIWDAYPEMQKETGLSFAELSRELTRMSLELFVRHPLLYAESVAQAGVGFWAVASYDWAEAISSPTIATALKALWRGQLVLLRLVNVAFLALCLDAALRRRLSAQRVECVAIAIVFVACISQALLERGENARYALPFEPLVIYAVAVLTCMRQRLATHRTSAAPAPQSLVPTEPGP